MKVISYGKMVLEAEQDSQLRLTIGKGTAIFHQVLWVKKYCRCK